jgi:Haem-binding domain
MNNNINEEKHYLNFSTFGTYPVAWQYKLFDNIGREVKEVDMLLTSYTLTHRNAILSESLKTAIETWVAASRKQIEENFPLPV